MAGHRSPRGRVHPVAPARAGGTHRAASAGPLRLHVLAAAAAAGAVATGTLTALVPGSGGAPEAVPDRTASPVLVASADALPAMKAMTPGETMLPVASALDDADTSTEQRVASVQKAGRLAAQLADLHAREQRDQAVRARTTSPIRGGGLDGWIADALQVMDLPQNLAPGVKQIIMSESGGNPRAINNWDSNARRGTPSRGLMQTIPSTFRAYVHPELSGRPINDPVANITAGVRYMIERYGVDTVRAGGRSSAGGGYLGY